MLNRGAQGEIHGIADGDLNRLVRFVQGIVIYVDGDYFCGFPHSPGQCACVQGIVGTATGGCAAGDHIVHRCSLARFGGELDCQLNQAGGLVAAGGGGSEGNRRRIVVILYGVGVLRRGTDVGVGRVADGYRQCLVGLVGCVIDHGHEDVFGIVAGSEGQGAGRQGVIHSSLHRRAAGDGVIHGHRLSGHRV